LICRGGRGGLLIADVNKLFAFATELSKSSSHLVFGRILPWNRVSTLERPDQKHPQEEAGLGESEEWHPVLMLS